MRLHGLIKFMLVAAAVTAFAACGQNGSPLGPSDQPTISSETASAPSGPAVSAESTAGDSTSMTTRSHQPNAVFKLGGWNGLGGGGGAVPYGMARDCYALCIE